MNEFVLALFEGTAQGMRYGRARRGWRRFAAGIVALVVLAAAGGEGFFFWRAWTTGVWGRFFFDTMPLLQVFVFLLKGAAGARGGGEAARGGGEWRRAVGARGGDAA